MTETPDGTDADSAEARSDASPSNVDSTGASLSSVEQSDADRSGAESDGVEWADVLEMVAAVAPSWSVERIRQSDGGTDEVAFLTVTTPDGLREVVLKAFSGDGVPAAVARSEPRVLELLSRETEIPVPEVIGFVDQHPDLPAPFFLAERLPGEDGSGRFPDLSPAALETVFADAGTHLAALHERRSFDRFGRVGVEDGDLAVVGDQFGPRKQWTDWLLADAEDTLDGLAGGRFDDLVGPLRNYVRDAIPALDGPETASLVHWDYRLGNILVDPETGETTGVLDWADLVAGDPVYNLVTVEDHNVNWQTRDVVLRERLRGALLDAYAERRTDGLPTDAERRGGDRSAEFRERKRVYHLCNRLNAMACLPDWYADADEAVREERAAEHRMFVRSYLE
ncbi:phosphotransferase [Halorussus limi]|uniref:Phosphotransferase n=1 Tax=Halorussus limi TaxID=2938695 RepID=A0A8U0HVR2_9EURY|nr:phosphotransferase [Halorussus limi]UPV74801.1 phosphotransferase [Halorussus limi]